MNMRKLFKSKITFLLAVILLVTVAVASTFALLMVVTQSLRNLFSPPTISCQTTYDDDTDTWTVTNDGDVAVYVRVAVVPYLTNASDKVFWNTPVCTVTYDDTKWSVLGKHGYYYYSKTLAPKETVVFGSAVVNAAAAAQFGFDVSKVVVNAEAFQVGSDDALLDAWGVAYDQESGFSAEGACTHPMAYVNVSNEYHKYVCSACGYVSSFARHSLTNATNNDDGTHSGTCACGYNISSVTHTVAYEYVDGTNHTAFCTLCDWSETQTCSYTTDPVLDVGGSTYHRRMCACGAGQELAAHTFTYKDNGDGTHSYWCDTETGGCGYVASTADHSSMLTDRSETEHTYSCPSCRYAVSTEHDMQMVSAGESGHRSVCVICDYGSTDEPTAHNMTQYTNTGHLNTHVVSCADCGYSVTEEHTVTRTSVDDTYHRVTCSECGYDENIAHTYTYTSNGEEQHTVGCELCTYQSTVDHELEYERINESTHTVRCKKCPYTATKNHAITYTITADTHTAKCDQCGYTGSASSHTDFEYTSVDGSTHSVTCGVCGYGFTASHTITYTSNSDGHTPKCDICHYTGTATAHDAISYTNKTDTTHTMTCATCNYTGSATNHTKAYVQNGSSGHTWTCSVCQKSVTEAHDGNATCVCGYVALTYQKQFSMLSEDMQPVLANSNGNVYEESVLFIDGVSITKNLLYPISQVLEVKFVDPNTGVVTYYNEGEHYTVSNGQISMISNSGIKCMPAATWNNWAAGGEGADLAAGKYWGEKDAMIKWQVRVTYKTNSTWTGAEQISYYNTKYANFLEKLRNGKDVTILFFGDSITWGANAAFNIGYKPEDGYSYSILLTQALADLYNYEIEYVKTNLVTSVYGNPQQPPKVPDTKYTPSSGVVRGKITYINTAVGGWKSSDAANNLASHLCSWTNTYGCDLLIVAFGMNDTDIGADGTASNVEHIVNHVKTDVGNGITPYPDAAVMLVSSMIPNPDSSIKIDYTGQETQLSNLASQYTYTAHVDMTSISEAVYSKKGLFADYSGNNVNHPNDFLHRLYAQTLFEALIGYENIDKALSGEGADGTVERIGFHLDAHTIDGVDAVGDISIAGSQTLGLRGWVGYTLAITHYGYNIDGGPIFWTTESGGDTKDADKIIAAGGQYAKRFHIQTSMSGLSVGQHTVEFFVKLTDGSAQSLGALTPNVTSYSGPQNWASLMTAGSLDTFTTNGNIYSNLPVNQWNATNHSTPINVTTSDSMGLYGWAAFDSVLDDVGYYWDSPSNGYTWQGSLGAETDSAVTASGGANARRFHVNAPMSSAPSNGVHTVHYVGKLSDGTIVEFESWVMNIG
jgi:hypothetical protein